MYSVFIKCFNHELQNMNITERNNVFMFTTYFTDTHITKNKYKIESLGMMKYKYHIFINHHKSICFSNGYNKIVLDLFRKTQRKYMALLHFKNICMWKKVYKNAGIVNTIEFDCLDDIPNNRRINIIEDKIIYKFSIYDLIKIINKSLTYHVELFSEPIKVKNPWTNKEFTYSTLLSIYHFIHFNSKVMNMPLLLKRYYMSNFVLKVFERNNDFLIKDSILKNFHQQDNTELLIYIDRMIRNYNKKYVDYTIEFDPDFPKQEKINIMLPYLEHYVQYRFSIDEKIRQFNKAKFMYKLYCFKRSNRLTGRKIKCYFIHKLFQVSLFYHKSKQLVEEFTKCKNGTIPTHLQEDSIAINMPSSNTYPIPSVDMIDINNKCYWIGKKNIYDFTLFIDVDKIPNSRKIAIHDDLSESIHSFRSYVKHYVFNTSHLFYMEKFLPRYVSLNKQIFKKKPRSFVSPQSTMSNTTEMVHYGNILDENRLSTNDRPSTPTLESDDDSDDESETDNREIIRRTNLQYVHHYIVATPSQSRIRQYGSFIDETHDNDDDNNDDDDDNNDDDDDDVNMDEDDDSITVVRNFQNNDTEIDSDTEINSDAESSETASITYTVTNMHIENNSYNNDNRDTYAEEVQAELHFNNNTFVNLHRDENDRQTISSRPSPELLNDIFGYDTDVSIDFDAAATQGPDIHTPLYDEHYDHGDTVESFNQYDLHQLQDRIINSLPPSSLTIDTNIQPIQTVFRPIDMDRINAVTPQPQLTNSNNHDQLDSDTDC